MAHSSVPSADLQTGAKSVVALRAVNGIRSVVELQAKNSTLGDRALSPAKTNVLKGQPQLAVPSAELTLRPLKPVAVFRAAVGKGIVECPATQSLLTHGEKETKHAKILRVLLRRRRKGLQNEKQQPLQNELRRQLRRADAECVERTRKTAKSVVALKAVHGSKSVGRAAILLTRGAMASGPAKTSLRLSDS